MIDRIFCDGNLNILKRNYEYVKTLSSLEQDSKNYVVGLDIANEYSVDSTVMCWFSKNEDGSLKYEGYKFIEKLESAN